MKVFDRRLYSALVGSGLDTWLRRYGVRRLSVFALALYALVSVAGGLARSSEVIVIARAVQGIGATFLFPATLSLINRLLAEGPEQAAS